MSAADALATLERNAALMKRAKLMAWIIAAAAVVVVTGTCTARRSKANDDAIATLEHETAAAQRARHAATLQVITAKRELASERTMADSLERTAAAAEERSAALSRFVRVASETSLVVQVTPSAPSIAVSVPHIVTEYIDTLVATIAEKDAALAARDSHAARADTVILYQELEAKTDSVIITKQDSTITDEKKARPRFGIRTGLAIGATVALAATHPADVAKVLKFLIGLVR